MKNLIITIASFFLFTAFSSTHLSVTEDAILGEWYTPGQESIVTIFKDQDVYHGKITWLKEPTDSKGKPIKDYRNTEQALRDRKLMELNILKNLQFEDDGTWTDGEIYSPRKGKKFSCLIEIEDSQTLAVRGYKGYPTLGMTFYWKRKK